MNLYMAVDFSDDMIVAWDRARLREFMKMNVEAGVKRISWIYHGNREDGFWENANNFRQQNYIDTFKAIGNPYLKAAVEEAHDAGLEIFAVYKPFEVGIQTIPTRQKAHNGKMPIVGGKMNLVFNFALEHRDALMQRRIIETIPATKIILKSQEKLKSDHQFQLWKSKDNKSYYPVGNLVYPNVDAFSVEFYVSGEERFFAIESHSDNKLSNKLESIIEVKSADDKKLQFSLGLEPKKYRIKTSNHLEREYDIGMGFKQEGFYFDYLPGIPSSVFVAEKVKNRIFSLSDNGQNVIAVALDVNDCVPGAPEPAESRTVDYWLSMIQKTLDCGVDGVDIRLTNHNSILNWDEYGFNKPVVDEYVKRYGINPEKEPFDKENLRRLRGEFYSAFLEKAAALIKGSGKKLALHIPDVAFGNPEESTMMEIHWDWRGWLAKNIPDEVTFKLIDIDNSFSPASRELVRLCKNKKIPVSVSPFSHCITDWPKYLESIENFEFDSFTFYEAATFWRASPNGFEDICPSLNKIIHNKFGK